MTTHDTTSDEALILELSSRGYAILAGRIPPPYAPTGSNMQHTPEMLSRVWNERLRQVELHQTGRFDNLTAATRGALEARAPHPKAIQILVEELGEYATSEMEGDAAGMLEEIIQVAACATAIAEGLYAMLGEAIAASVNDVMPESGALPSRAKCRLCAYDSVSGNDNLCNTCRERLALDEAAAREGDRN